MACRAGSTSAYCRGDDRRLLGNCESAALGLRAPSGFDLIADGTPGGGQPSPGDTAQRPIVASLRVGLSNLTSQPLRSVPVTFGHAFRQGHFPRAVRVTAVNGSGSFQADIKRRYPDGSIRFAVISALLDALAPQQALELELAPADPPSAPAAGITPADLLKQGFDVVVAFRFPDGAVRRVSARRLLERANDKTQVWLQGPVATEWLLAGVPEDDQGKADDDLCVRFQVRAFHGGTTARVSVAVENCWDSWAGNIRYDVAVSVGGREVFQRQAVDHRPLSRWRQVFWWGRDEPPLHVRHDVGCLIATGALPHYDRFLPPAPAPRGAEDAFAMTGPVWDILGRGPLTAYMPTTGGRPEIAPYPLWTVRYLLSMEPRARSFVLAAGDLAGSWPIHVRARATDRIMTIDARPEFWLDERGQDRPRWKPPRHAPDPKQERLSPDLAHQPSLAYVPYLVTGDYYHLEEAYFWANFCLLSSWPHPREKARGLIADQIRGDAWALRNLGDAAWVATDGDPEHRYFEEKIRNNVAHRTAKMCGPPEFNRIGAWHLRTVEDARIQNPANPRWLITVPWEADYLLWSLHHLIELGWPEAARPRDFLLRLRVGLLTHAPDFDPRLAAPYRLVVGEKGPDGKPVIYEDWPTLGRENARLSKPGLDNCGGCYPYSARAALVCGVDGGFSGAREALAVLEALLPGHREIMAREPIWALAPRDTQPTAPR
jgi:hypothetical protein